MAYDIRLPFWSERRSGAITPKPCERSHTKPVAFMLAAALVTTPLMVNADPWEEQAGQTARFLPNAEVSADEASQIKGEGYWAIIAAVQSASAYCLQVQCHNWYDLLDGYRSLWSLGYDAYKDWRKNSRYKRMDADDFVRAWMRAEGVRIPRGYMKY